jgi:hypothetical protein
LLTVDIPRISNLSSLRRLTMKFYAIILPTETDMDFSFYKSEGGPALDDGEEIFAEGDTAEEAWANLMKAYKVGAHGRTSYLHPDQLGESYHPPPSFQDHCFHRGYGPFP